MNKTAALALLIAASVSASALAAENSAWRSDGPAAGTHFPARDLAVIVGFSPIDHCDTAQLLVSGNAQVTRIGLVVDRELFDMADIAFRTDDIVGLTIRGEALAALKHGALAAVVTDQGNLFMSLSGSSDAFDAAYANCEAIASDPQQAAEWAKPADAPPIPSLAAPSTVRF